MTNIADTVAALRGTVYENAREAMEIDRDLNSGIAVLTSAPFFVVQAESDCRLGQLADGSGWGWDARSDVTAGMWSRESAEHNAKAVGGRVMTKREWQAERFERLSGMIEVALGWIATGEAKLAN